MVSRGVEKMITNIPLNAILPGMWERIDGNRFFIGSHYVASLEGDRERGYLITYPNRTNGYAPNITIALRKMRIVYWAEQGL